MATWHLHSAWVLQPAARLTAAGARLALPVWRRLALALLSLAGCYLAARLLWLVIPAPLQEGPMPTAVPGSAQREAPAIDLAQLKGLSLFGAASAGGVDPQELALPPALASAEETRLDLELQGVLGSADHAHDRAIIAHKGSQGLFAPGDALPGGSRVTLERILPGRVILNNAGTYESLWLYEPDLRQQALAAAERAKSVTRPVPRTEPKSVTPPATETTESEQTSPPPLTGTLADIVRFTAEQQDGRLVGYRIAPGPAASRFHQLGFQDQDLVTAVNGVAMDNPSNALRVYRQMRERESARFELLRDGQPLRLEISLEIGQGAGDA